MASYLFILLFNFCCDLFHLNRATPPSNLKTGGNSVCIMTSREQRIATRTASAQQWVLEKYGGESAFSGYISGLKTEHLLRDRGRRLSELCNLEGSLADDLDNGDTRELEDLKALFSGKIEWGRKSYSAAPLTFLWLVALACTLVVILLSSYFGHQETKMKCLSTPHIIVASYLVCSFTVLSMISKWWIVSKEQAGSVADCPAARLVSIWDVLGLVQWRVGTVVLVLVVVGCLGKEWYTACLASGG